MYDNIYSFLLLDINLMNKSYVYFSYKWDISKKKQIFKSFIKIIDVSIMFVTLWN